MVLPIGSLMFDSGCYVDSLTIPLGRIMAAATTSGGRYTVNLSSDGLRVTICATAPQRDGGSVAIWVGSPTASRG